MRIKKDDNVKIISGKDNGKTGKVLRTIRDKNRIVVDGLNIIKKHTRPKKEGEKGERVEIPAPINVSNVMLICPNCSKLTRVAYSKNGEAKMRICKKCGKEIK